VTVLVQRLKQEGDADNPGRRLVAEGHHVPREIVGHPLGGWAIGRRA